MVLVSFPSLKQKFPNWETIVSTKGNYFDLS